MARSRSNGITGGDIRLNAYFYKNNELENPSSIKKVEINNVGGETIASYAGSSVSYQPPGRRANTMINGIMSPNQELLHLYRIMNFLSAKQNGNKGYH